MTGETILIAAFSGRALAQSARRAGYVPLVADAFGDTDMRKAAGDYRVVPGVMDGGFSGRTLISVLDAIVDASKTKPIGIVLGSGLEDKPMLWDALDRRYRVLGCSAETVRTCKDPDIFFGVLDELGITHPETQNYPPPDVTGWISKRVGGSGGRHIRVPQTRVEGRARRYFQKLVKGARISVSALITREGISTAFSQQWTAPSAALPFRYGGAVSLDDGSAPFQASMLATVEALARAFELKGLVSFDFIVDDTKAYLLEINPRPGATVDVFDDAQGTLIQSHIEACSGAASHERRGGTLDGRKAAAILHADRGPLTLGKFDWPEWTADRGATGTFVPHGAPLATVFAEGQTSDDAQALALARLAELESLIYEHSDP
jgi:predicted ATP-grasp superfamily ATP-dependent carboligase